MNRRWFTAAIGAAAAGVAVETFAQPAGKVFRLGVLTLSSSEQKSWIPGMVRELGELGLREGRNLAVEFASADDFAGNLRKQAAKLVDKQPDALVAGFGTETAQALKAATPSVPIIFTGVDDPLAAGLVTNLERPGGTITGVMNRAAGLAGKRLSLLADITGGKTSFAILGNPDAVTHAAERKELEQAAAAGKTTIRFVEARSRPEIEKALDALRGAVAGVVLLSDPVVDSMLPTIAERAKVLKLPTMFGAREAVQLGGLISYGAHRARGYALAAALAARILRGARPGDLAVQRPTKFETLINLTTAKAIGLSVPPAMLAGADDLVQ